MTRDSIKRNLLTARCMIESDSRPQFLTFSLSTQLRMYMLARPWRMPLVCPSSKRWLVAFPSLQVFTPARANLFAMVRQDYSFQILAILPRLQASFRDYLLTLPCE